MAEKTEPVETSIDGVDRDDIGNSKEENQFNFGAGKTQEIDPRWKHPGEWQYEEDGMIVTRTSVWSAPGCHEGCGVLVYSDKETGKFIKCEGDPASAARTSGSASPGTRRSRPATRSSAASP